MAFEFIRSETQEGVLVLTLNDPKTRNSLTPELTAELEAELDRFAGDPDLRVLVLTGEDPAFCSGANVRGFSRSIQQREQEGPPPAPSAWERLDPVYTPLHAGKYEAGPSLVRLLHNLQKPTIAAVNGYAFGLGCGLALCCDLRIASERAQFAEAFVRNGLIPADGSCWQLPKLIGISNTLWMQYTGEAVNGQDAYRLGMVNRVVPHDELMPAALELATRLAQGPTYSMSLIKLLVHRAYLQDLPEHLVLATRAQDLARQTEDHKEGVQAFLEKRKPVFKGR
ncbi:MAG: enoyl-CoA hydratase/isomerase family protein [Chloroflexi bacterium]|nr:enoyl-CoA hydratase/isomerase family protein [Chloroflexota bacterium]